MLNETDTQLSYTASNIPYIHNNPPAMFMTCKIKQAIMYDHRDISNLIDGIKNISFKIDFNVEVAIMPWLVVTLKMLL